MYNFRLILLYYFCRCRSAFKLLEINEKYNILKAGQYVVDCGAAPGSWTQVLVNAVNSNGSNNDLPKGSVISVDKQQIFPIQVSFLVVFHIYKYIILGCCNFR